MRRLYFRIKDTGCLVFRMVDNPNHGRLRLEHVATVNLRSDKVRVQDKVELTDEEVDQIDDWKRTRAEQIQRREGQQVEDLVERINLVTQWLEMSRNSAEAEKHQDALFTAMHDLRLVLMRKARDQRSEAS